MNTMSYVFFGPTPPALVYGLPLAGGGRVAGLAEARRVGRHASQGTLRMVANEMIVEPLFSTLANDPELGRIVPLFVEEMPGRVGQLTARLESADWDGLRQVAHQMKGAAGSYGFQPITPVAARLEQAIKDGQAESEIRRLAEELIALCSRVRAGSPQ